MGERKIEVDISRLRDDADDIGQELKDIRKMLDTLRDSADKLAAMWEGPSRDAFTQTFESHLSILEDGFSALNELHNYEDYSVQEYNDCERRVGNLVNQVSVG